MPTLILKRFLYFCRQTLIFLLFKSDGDVDLHKSSLDNILSSNLEPWNKTISADHVGKKLYFLLDVCWTVHHCDN